MKCNDQLIEFDNLLKQAKSLDRLFNGLMEENDVDLTIPRLNAYREHFNLKEKIEETANDLEYIEYKFKTEEESVCGFEEVEIIERIEETFEDDAIIQEEDYGVAEEIYLEPFEDLIEPDGIIESGGSQQQLTISIQKNRRGDATKRTEDEKLFNFQCHICQHPMFSSMKTLTLHCRIEHNCLPFVKCCSADCEASLSTWRRLLIHKDKHFPDNDKPRCNECNR